MKKLTSQDFFNLHAGLMELTRKEERRAWEDGRIVNMDYIDRLFQLDKQLDDIKDDIEKDQQHSNPFANLLSAAEAAAAWGINPSSIRRAVQDKRLQEGIDCNKFGKQWVITVQAMTRVFGQMPVQQEHENN